KRGYEDGTFWPKELPLEPYLNEQPSAVLPRGEGNDEAGGPRAGGGASHAVSAFAGLRGVELGGQPSEWAGQVLAELAADVAKSEAPKGGGSRGIGPFLDDLPHPDRSLSFWHSNTSKRSVTLDLDASAGREILRRLIQHADVVIDGCPPGRLTSLGLGYEHLKE